MSEPRRLVESERLPAELRAAAKVLEKLPPQPPVPRQVADATWDGVLARTVVGRRRGWVWAVPALAAAVAAMLAVWVAQEPPGGLPGAVRAQDGAELLAASAASPARVLRGKVEGHPSARGADEALVTPHGRVVWRDARFLVDVTDERTLLFVDEGNVVWRSVFGERTLTAGAELRAPPVVAALPPSRSCPATPVEARVSCLERLAEGSGLGAQNALFELGWVELHQRGAPSRALTQWERYLQRFPEGALEAEARALRVLTFAEQGEVEAARDELAQFREALPGDPLLTPLSSLPFSRGR